jgi:hypothetical protein
VRQAERSDGAALNRRISELFFINFRATLKPE